MEFNDAIAWTKIALLVSLLLFCSATDLRTRRVPNAVLLPALMTSMFLNSVGSGLAGLVDSIAGLALGVLMLMPLHVLGRMGAGDVKLLGVVGSILGAWGAVVAGLATMMAGGILGVAYIAWLVVKPSVISLVSGAVQGFSGKAAAQVTSRQTARAAEIPYTIAIAAGTFATFFYLDLLSELSIT